MAERPLEGMMSVTLDKIREMVGSNTIIGEPITLEGTTILPVSKVTFGFASGGSDLPSKAHPEKEYFGGGAGAGVTVTPLGFLTISGGNVRLLQIDPYNSSADRVIGMIPEVADKINEFFASRKAEKQEKEAEKDVTLEDPQV